MQSAAERDAGSRGDPRSALEEEDRSERDHAHALKKHGILRDTRDARGLESSSAGAERVLAAASELTYVPARAGARAAVTCAMREPGAYSALEPHISRKTIEFHYDKHHAGYVAKHNDLLKGSALATLGLEQLIVEVARDASKASIFNNAAQVWNHTFYWNSLRPNSGAPPAGRLGSLIDKSFGSYAGLEEQLASAATTQFGSGWAWLVLDGSKLVVIKTSNAETPLTMNVNPLLTIDVCEHAYYLDRQNARSAYVQACIDNLLNWEFAAHNLG